MLLDLTFVHMEQPPMVQVVDVIAVLHGRATTHISGNICRGHDAFLPLRPSPVEPSGGARVSRRRCVSPVDRDATGRLAGDQENANDSIKLLTEYVKDLRAAYVELGGDLEELDRRDT